MQKLKSWLLDLLFPRQCLGCRIPLPGGDESYICPACLAGIKIKGDFACAFCGSPVVAGKTCPFCSRGRYLDRLWVTTSYENPLVEKILKTMKYRFVKTLAFDMARLMAEYLERRFASGSGAGYGDFLVVPVPLHRRRLNWRGFNQAEIIGSAISQRLNLEFRNVLHRKHNRTPQAQIVNRESRIASVKGIFECSGPGPVQDKTIILVDDIATTGSTLNDCARALKDAGAKEVIGFVFARGDKSKNSKILTCPKKDI